MFVLFEECFYESVWLESNEQRNEPVAMPGRFSRMTRSFSVNVLPAPVGHVTDLIPAPRGPAGQFSALDSYVLLDFLVV